MIEEYIIRFYHPALNIGLEDIRNAWLLSEPPVKLSVSLHRGSLVYRLPSSGKRISYLSLKKGLIKKKIVIRQSIPLLPF